MKYVVTLGRGYSEMKFEFDSMMVANSFAGVAKTTYVPDKKDEDDKGLRAVVEFVEDAPKAPEKKKEADDV